MAFNLTIKTALQLNMSTVSTKIDRNPQIHAQKSQKFQQIINKCPHQDSSGYI